MTLENTYQISDLDRAMAQRISTHTGIAEVKILRSIVISKEHVRVVRIRAIKAGRLNEDGFPVGEPAIAKLHYANVS
jgi:hypothetical protein